MKILAIETSCDETSASVIEKVDNQINVLSNITTTSSTMHAATGGIIPENASREQAKAIIPVIIEALSDHNNKNRNTQAKWISANEIIKQEIDAIAITYGPGLIGSLLVGVETAKTLSFALDKPIIPVNHLLAHIFANFIGDTTKIHFPFIGLIVSGGHTDLLLFKSINEFKWLGGTRDDAAGEAIDKIGRILNLAYPAGPEMEKRGKDALVKNIKFQSPLINSDDLDFSFSGLKAEASRFIEKQKLTNGLTNEICHAVQDAIFKVLVKKTVQSAIKYKCGQILLGGGVSANNELLKRFENTIADQELNLAVLKPELQYSTDNAAMIGAYALMNNKTSKWDKVTANPELYFD